MPDVRGRPNLLFILTDQQRADAMGAVSPWMKTPAMDRLASEGIRFSKCITQSPGCIPARASLTTGLYPHNTGVWNNRGFTLPATARTWVRNIQAAGYRTSMVGKTHLHPQYGDLRDRRSLVESWGFDQVMEIAGPHGSAVSQSDMTEEWESAGLWEAYRADLQSRSGESHFSVRPSPLGLDHHYDSFVGRTAVEHIRGFGFDRPWFCWVGFGGPHEPWDAPEPYFSMYRPDEVPQPLQPIASVARTRPRGLLLDDRMAADAVRLSGLGPSDIAALRANYAGKVSLIDRYVGELLAVLEERAELDRTVIVLSSDHGEMNGDHGLMHKSCFLEGAVTVPLLVRVPQMVDAGGRIIDSPVELIDVGATLADAAGASADHVQWGRSLWPILSDEAPAVRELAISEQRGEITGVDDHWKVALNNDGGAYLCVDLKEDPDETTNLAGTRAVQQVEREFRERLLARILGTQLFDEWY